MFLLAIRAPECKGGFCYVKKDCIINDLKDFSNPSKTDRLTQHWTLAKVWEHDGRSIRRAVNILEGGGNKNKTVIIKRELLSLQKNVDGVSTPLLWHVIQSAEAMAAELWGELLSPEVEITPTKILDWCNQDWGEFCQREKELMKWLDFEHQSQMRREFRLAFDAAFLQAQLDGGRSDAHAG